MLPGLDGIGLCRRIRETSTDPILMMSARGDAQDVVSGLEAGADDYVVKPVDTAVLVARIRSLLRRASFAPAARPDGLDPSTDSNQRRQQDQYARLVFGDLVIDTGGLEVFLAGQPIALAPSSRKLVDGVRRWLSTTEPATR
jgi:DNA-binding response OmpR family regulator